MPPSLENTTSDESFLRACRCWTSRCHFTWSFQATYARIKLVKTPVSLPLMTQVRLIRIVLLGSPSLITPFKLQVFQSPNTIILAVQQVGRNRPCSITMSEHTVIISHTVYKFCERKIHKNSGHLWNMHKIDIIWQDFW